MQMLQGKVAPADAPPIFEAIAPIVPNMPSRNLRITAHALCLVRLGRFEDADRELETFDDEFLEAIAPDHYERRLHFQTLVEFYEGLGPQTSVRPRCRSQTPANQTRHRCTTPRYLSR